MNKLLLTASLALATNFMEAQDSKPVTTASGFRFNLPNPN